MDRRAYLTALGTTVAAVSGCSEEESTGTATAPATTGATETPTTTETPATTQTPEPDPAPRITEAGLLLTRNDRLTLAEELESIGRGGDLGLEAEYELPVSDGAADGTVEARVIDSEGTQIERNSDEASAVVNDGSEFRDGESRFVFDTASWELGSYTAEILVNSEGYGTTSSTELPVEIVEPLGEGEVELRLAEFPDNAVARETFEWTLGVRNLSDRDSSLVTDTVTIDLAGNEPVESDIRYRRNIPAGEEVLIEEEIGFRYSGTYTYRIDAVDAEFSFTIGSPR